MPSTWDSTSSPSVSWSVDLASQTASVSDRSAAGQTTTLMDRLPVVWPLPRGLCHLTDWRFRFGSAWDVPGDDEEGVQRGYHRSDHDDSGWAPVPRVGSIAGAFPTWEPDSYLGYCWYRSRFTVPPTGGPGDGAVLELGAANDPRGLSWEVWLDGRPITSEPVPCPKLAVTVEVTPGDHVLAVRQRVRPPERPAALRSEQESWRRVDPFCRSDLHWDDPEPVRFTDTDSDGNLTDASGLWWLRLDYRRDESGIVRTGSVGYRGTDPVTVGEVELGGMISSAAWHYHAEGAWAGTDDGWAVAVADPGGIITSYVDGPVGRFWPGVGLGPGHDHLDLLPMIFDHHRDGWPAAIRHRLDRSGPSRRAPAPALAVYDPYGWYQISHASEPKIELDVAMVEQMDQLLTELAANPIRPVRFSHLALDCGWNDPDDLASFHPSNFPNGPDPVRDLCRRHDLDLVLWVSPSDGARAFRHELGLVNPGLEACLVGDQPGVWRLCPAAEPWRTQFTAALQSLVRGGARGFKIDGTELFCTATDHGHLPGIWSVYATSRALAELFASLREAVHQMVIMLYWGLRSPWWLRWADTIWDNDYLVEAAAPSGRPAWSLRSSVSCCQDNGQFVTWSTQPSSRQDTLGVWLSATTWASRQGPDGWDDAMIMDLARGNRILQPWGDLRPWLATPDRIAQVLTLAEQRDELLLGNGHTIGDPEGSTGYGYAWTNGERVWVVLSRPGPGGVTRVEPEALAGRRPTRFVVDYRTEGAEVEAGWDGAELVVAQSAGSVVALLLGSDDLPHGVALTERVSAPTRGQTVETRQPRVTEVVVRSSPPVPASEAEQLTIWVGRVPSLADWGRGPTSRPPFSTALVDRLPPLDREIEARRLDLTGTVELDHPGQLAVVLRWHRDGVAWHNDLVHEVTRIDLTVDGTPVQPEDLFPTFRHEQAGSWSWSRFGVGVPAGRHRVAATVTTAAPRSVSCALELWAR